jgi:hypothetical protein
MRKCLVADGRAVQVWRLKRREGDETREGIVQQLEVK